MSHSNPRRWLYGLLALVLLLIAARLALPFIVKSWMNQRLSELEHYSGHVDDVDIALWRGAYQLRDVRLVQLDSAIDEPLLAVPLLDIQIRWQALIDGTLVVRIRAEQPHLSFGAGHRDRAAQTGEGVDWTALFEQLTPFRIDRLEIASGQIHYYDLHSKPKVDVHLDEVQALLTNLTNASDRSGRRVAVLQLEALAMAQSKLSLDLSIDPFAEQPDFSLKLKLLGLDVVRLRDAMRAYTPFDPAGGKLDLIVEATGRDGGVEGYVKPLFSDLKLVDWQRELATERNPLQLLVSAVGSLLNLVFQNQPKDQLATRIPFSGRLDEPNVAVLATLGNVLRNAFIKAFEPSFERDRSDDPPPSD